MAQGALHAPAGERPDFVLIGPAGFLGSSILRSLQGLGCRVVPSSVRLQDRLGIEQLFDEQKPTIGVVCAAGERGRPNISWCDSHPVETVDANITGQLNVAAAAYARGLHCTLLGTGAMYVADPQAPGRRFTEQDPPNMPEMKTYVALRQKMEELLAYFDNVVTLRVCYPMSSDLDPRGLIGKLARFKKVDRVVTSVTILEDLCPLIVDMAKRRVRGPVNFVNSGTVAYADIVEMLKQKSPPGWAGPQLADAGGAPRPAAELDVQHFAKASGREIPDATASVRRIISRMSNEDFASVMEGQASAL